VNNVAYELLTTTSIDYSNCSSVHRTSLHSRCLHHRPTVMECSVHR